MADSTGVPGAFFDAAYAGAPPWEIGRAQDDVVRLFDRDGFKGRVLDIGCGTGENALFLSGKGLDVTGIDRVGVAVERAQAKAAERGLTATFQVGDALKPADLGGPYDTVLDCGLFHTLSNTDRTRYLRAMAELVRPGGQLHILCFSELEPGLEGPRRVGERELIDLFNMKGWLVEEVAEARYETTIHPDGARAWLATFTRWKT
ncbi:MAG: class I SAM-dependent methyltransferase [Gemmataceae bacterium]